MQQFAQIDNVLLSHEYVNKTTEQVPWELLLAACREWCGEHLHFSHVCLVLEAASCNDVG